MRSRNPFDAQALCRAVCDGVRAGATRWKYHALVLLVLALACGTSPQTTVHYTKEQLMDPQTCKPCHPTHYADWSASMHAYASDDPLFIAMNARGQDQAQIGKFCVNCHAPMAVQTGRTVDGRNLATLPQAVKGVTCYYCHNVDGVLDTHNDASLHFADDGVMRAALADAVPNSAHASTYSSIHDGTKLESAQFCGNCHDVVNGHGAHIERTFEEWSHSVYDTTAGGNTCIQCHMRKSTGVAANAPAAPQRDVHEHKFPGVDTPLTAVPGAQQQQMETQRSAVQEFLNTSLQTALCVRGAGSSASILVVADNVAAGHDWPSGVAQDRRAWFQVIASVAGTPIYESGVVLPGQDPADSMDGDLWLLRECLVDGKANVVRNFWEAVTTDGNQLPGQMTYDQMDPRYYQTHIMQTYPRDASTTLSAYPDTVTLDVHLLPFSPDLFDDLIPPGDPGFSATMIQEMRAKLVPMSVGSTLTWTVAAARDSMHGGTEYLDHGVPVLCISNTGLNAAADKVVAPRHTNPACNP
ncbi:MAG: hypothetical protein M3O46_18900 [Myxococcota bacterium]|nr:hypothetical protein [Myxococcota bacterium]